MSKVIKQTVWCGCSDLRGKNAWCNRAAKVIVTFPNGTKMKACEEHSKRFKPPEYPKGIKIELIKAKKKTSKIEILTCPDCTRTYTQGAPHRMFCAARTCRNCGTTYGHILPVYDSRPDALDEEGQPERLCDNCLEELMINS